MLRNLHNSIWQPARRRGSTTLTYVVVLGVGLAAFFVTGWLYLQTSTVAIDKSPVVDLRSGKSKPGALSTKLAVPGSRASQGLRCEDPTDAQISAAIRAATDYLVRVSNSDGSFVYRENLNPEYELSERYNMLRHAGAIYALARGYHWRTDNAVRDTVLRSAEFLKSAAIAPLPSQPDLLAVWSRPETTGDDAPAHAKLGGAGLALVALISAAQLDPNAASLDDLRRLGRFILYMQKEDGGFYSKFIPSKGGRSDKWTSLYYPGEAATGLVMLYEQDPDARWLRAAALAIGHLAESRRGQDKVEADHWALIATKRILDLGDGVALPVSRKTLIDHAAQVCLSILAERPSFADSDLMHGGFTKDGRTCPTATRLEGLIDALWILPDEFQPLKERMRAAVDEGIGFLLRAQIVCDNFAGGMPRSICTLPPDHKYASDTFNRRATELRIDYVQHALCALIEFQHLNQQALALDRAAD